MSLTETFSEILNVYRDGLNLNREYWVDTIVQKGEYIIWVLVSLIADEYHNTKNLIDVFEKDGLYIKLIAT